MQRIALWAGIVVFALALLFPPWNHTTQLGGGLVYSDSFRFIIAPENNGLLIDAGAWAVILAAVAALTAAVYLALKPRS